MALPVVLGGAAVAAGLFGAKKGADAVKNQREAKKINEEAEKQLDTAQSKLKGYRRQTQRSLEKLGELRLQIWDQQIGGFVDTFEQLKNVELEGQVASDQIRPDHFSQDELTEMRQISVNAREITGGGAQALGSGAMAGIAAYGGATTLATASTGTAISSLSGAAATNATLAWFGGGSLASGGLGMTGGMAILGGVVAGPVLAVGGLVASSTTKTNLEKAKENRKEAEKAIEQMENTISILDGICDVSDSFIETTERMRDRFETTLENLDQLVSEYGVDYAKYPRSQREQVHEAVLFAQVTKTLLETPLLDEDGGLSNDHHTALKEAEDALANAS